MGSAAVVEMRGVSKSFDGVKALDNVGFVVRERAIQGLLGGNGAGKTTLMNILYGLYSPDAGDIYIRDEKVKISDPADALRHQIGMVHQHFRLIGNFTVAKNVVLGTKLQKEPILNLEHERERIQKLSDTFGFGLNPDAVVRDLPVGMRQRVEILKPIYRGAKLLILDEPTTNLTPQEVDFLFSSLDKMVQEGMSIVFITHKIKEAIGVCNEITVLRDGKLVGTVQQEDASQENLVRMMVGEELNVDESVLFSGAMVEKRPSQRGGKAVLVVKNLSVIKDEDVLAVKDNSFEVHEGEIFGVAGVSGNGQRELVEALVCVRPIADGGADFMGESVGRMGTKEMIAAGATYIPEDRVGDGCLSAANVAENLVLGLHDQEPYCHGSLMRWDNIFQTAKSLISDFGIKTYGPSETAARLSGGNIQKLIVARAFSRPSKLIVAHNPTRGLDIRYTELTYRKMIEARNDGTAILFVSENLDELLLLCDRMGVMYKGEMVGILNRSEFDRYTIGAMMGGVGKHDRSTTSVRDKD